MEIDALHWSLVSLIDLNHMLRTQVIQFDLLVMRAGSNAVAQGVELHLMNHSRVLLVSLDRFLCIKVPYVDQLVIA
jgi:hypothetical protein